MLVISAPSHQAGCPHFSELRFPPMQNRSDNVCLLGLGRGWEKVTHVRLPQNRNLYTTQWLQEATFNMNSKLQLQTLGVVRDFYRSSDSSPLQLWLSEVRRLVAWHQLADFWGLQGHSVPDDDQDVQLGLEDYIRKIYGAEHHVKSHGFRFSYSVQFILVRDSTCCISRVLGVLCHWRHAPCLSSWPNDCGANVSWAIPSAPLYPRAFSGLGPWLLFCIWEKRHLGEEIWEDVILSYWWGRRLGSLPVSPILNLLLPQK